MKQYPLMLSFLLLSSCSFAQNFTETFLKVDFNNVNKGPSVELLRQQFRYEVYPFHIPARPASKTKLSKAKAMSDLIKEYPRSWVSNYVSTEVLAVVDGETKRAKGMDESLNKAQQELLKMADYNTKVILSIQYEQENAAIRKIDIHNLNYQIAVIPDTEAEYFGGIKALKQYLKKNAIDRISDADLKLIKEGVVQFVINKKGQVEGVQLMEETGKPAVDELLLKAIEAMPKWSPAKDAKGKAIKQQFKFVAGDPFGGC